MDYIEPKLRPLGNYCGSASSACGTGSSDMGSCNTGTKHNTCEAGGAAYGAGSCQSGASPATDCENGATNTTAAVCDAGTII